MKISAGTHLTESAHKARGGLIRAHLLARDGVIADLMLSGDFTCLPVGRRRPPRGAPDRHAARRGRADRCRGAAMGGLALDMPGVEPADIAAAVMAAVAPAD